MPSVYFKLDGAQALLEHIEFLAAKGVQRILKRAIGMSATPILRQMRLRVRVGKTGALKASLTKFTKSYKNSGTVIAMIGPDNAVSSADNYNAGQRHRPSKIAHLIEYGHDVVRGGKKKNLWMGNTKTNRLQGMARVVGHAPAYPFVRPAMEGCGDKAREILAKEIGAGLEKAWAKANGGE